MTTLTVVLLGFGIALLFQLIAIGCWLIQIRKRLERILLAIRVQHSEGEAYAYEDWIVEEETPKAREGKDGTSD